MHQRYKGLGHGFFYRLFPAMCFCQNEQISVRREVGRALTARELSDVFFRLVEQGAHNINLVNPTHFASGIAEALRFRPLPVPVVYNSGGYERVETLRMLEGLISIYLPDYKYRDSALSQRLSGAADYPEHAAEAILEMVRQTGPASFDGDGMLQRGTIVRHLILPGHTRNSIEVLDWLKENLPEGTLVSLMAQYVPCGRAADYPEVDRRITKREYEKVQQHLFALGLDGYVQERKSAKKDFIPPFDLEGLPS